MPAEVAYHPGALLLVFVELFEHFAVNLFAVDECVHLEIVLKNADNRNNTLLITHIP